MQMLRKYNVNHQQGPLDRRVLKVHAVDWTLATQKHVEPGQVHRALVYCARSFIPICLSVYLPICLSSEFLWLEDCTTPKKTIARNRVHTPSGHITAKERGPKVGAQAESPWELSANYGHLSPVTFSCRQKWPFLSAVSIYQFWKYCGINVASFQ